MEFFILEHNPLYIYNPQIVRMPDGIDIADFKKNGTINIKPRTLLEFIGEKHTIFPDFLLDRVPLFTKKIKKIIDIFYNDIVYKEVILKDQNSSMNKMYFLAKLKVVEESAVLEAEKKMPKKIFSSAIENEDIFYLKYKDNIYLCANLIVVENIFRNGGHGFVLREIYTD